MHNNRRKKVLLVTIQAFNNYGNRLQNYALQNILESMGCKVVNLDTNEVPRIDYVYLLKFLIKKVLIHVGFSKYKPEFASRKRINKCRKFSQQYIHNYLFINRNELRNVEWNEYDYAITGSDQVWHNWERIEDELSFFYLDFIEPSKRVAYAPSFGFTNYPDQDRETHRKGLLNMAALSCREQEGCNLIYDLIGRKAVKVLDPTLLLEPKDWMKIEVKPTFRINERYILQFMLGNVSKEYENEIRRIADENSLWILNINDRMDPSVYGISPGEFVWLIHHAEVVCTDSFHASVLSILFERHLRVFQRITPQYGNMFGRLYDLLEPLSLINNVYGIGNNISTALIDSGQDYLKRERKKSRDYLVESLGIL